MTNKDHNHNVFSHGQNLKHIANKQLRPLKKVFMQAGFCHFSTKTHKAKATIPFPFPFPSPGQTACICTVAYLLVLHHQ